MAQQEPSININVKLSVEMSNAIDAKAESLAQQTGNPHTKSDVVRMALAQFLGLTTPQRNGDQLLPAAPSAVPST